MEDKVVNVDGDDGEDRVVRVDREDRVDKEDRVDREDSEDRVNRDDRVDREDREDKEETEDVESEDGDGGGDERVFSRGMFGGQTIHSKQERKSRRSEIF